MPIAWRATPTGRVEMVFSDPYTIRESEDAMKQVYADPRIVRPLRFLVDVRQSTPPDTEFVANAITFWQLHVSEMWGAKIAVMTATERQDGMAHLTEHTTEARELPFTLRVFHADEWDAARQWLASTL
jgi:hypothetical protein